MVEVVDEDSPEFQELGELHVTRTGLIDHFNEFLELLCGRIVTKSAHHFANLFGIHCSAVIAVEHTKDLGARRHDANN